VELRHKSRHKFRAESWLYCGCLWGATTKVHWTTQRTRKDDLLACQECGYGLLDVV